MSVTNPWLTPYQRSYQQIKAKLIDDLKNIKGPSGETLITDYSEGNLLIMIISLFSAIAVLAVAKFSSKNSRAVIEKRRIPLGLSSALSWTKSLKTTQ